jgi:hypothetical protein
MRKWSALALATMSVLTACHAPPAPAGRALAELPNWALASALPGIGDVPVGSTYGLSAGLTTTQPVTVSTPVPQVAGWTATPSACGVAPRLERLSSGAGAGAPLLNVSMPPDGQGMTFEVRRVPDAAAMIAEYHDWLRLCATYHLRGSLPGVDDDTYTYTVDPDVPAGADAAVGFEMLEHRGQGDPTIGERSSTAYYAVDGVLLTLSGSIGMVADDAAPVRKHAAAQTIARLRALKAPSWQLAPELAARSGAELAELLPGAGDFPRGWDTYLGKGDDTFGVGAGGAPAGYGHDCALLAPQWWPSNVSAATATSSETLKTVGHTAFHDLVIDVDREFDSAIVTATPDRAERCARQADDAPFTVVVLADTRHDDVQQLRYAVTWNRDHQDEARFPTYVSITRVAGLVVWAQATAAHTAVLDGLVDQTVANIRRQR